MATMARICMPARPGLLIGLRSSLHGPARPQLIIPMSQTWTTRMAISHSSSGRAQSTSGVPGSSAAALQIWTGQLAASSTTVRPHTALQTALHTALIPPLSMLLPDGSGMIFGCDTVLSCTHIDRYGGFPHGLQHPSCFRLLSALCPLKSLPATSLQPFLVPKPQEETLHDLGIDNEARNDRAST